MKKTFISIFSNSDIYFAQQDEKPSVKKCGLIREQTDETFK